MLEASKHLMQALPLPSDGKSQFHDNRVSRRISCMLLLLQVVLEMMHQMRKFLTASQILQCIAFAEAGLANKMLPTGIHTYCVRILSSMSEVILLHCKNAAVDMDTKVKMRAAVTRNLHSYAARINQLRHAVRHDSSSASL